MVSGGCILYGTERVRLRFDGSIGYEIFNVDEGCYTQKGRNGAKRYDTLIRVNDGQRFHFQDISSERDVVGKTLYSGDGDFKDRVISGIERE